MSDPTDHLTAVRAALDLMLRAWPGSLDVRRFVDDTGNDAAAVIDKATGETIAICDNEDRDDHAAPAEDAAAIVALRNAAPAIAALVDVRERPARDAACAHAATIRGADIPLRHGSWRSEVCRGCGAFRARNHHDELITWGPLSSWRPASEYADATDDGDSE